MSRNIEVKARVDDVGLLKGRIAVLSDQPPVQITQDDVFFACPDGRIKLRFLSEGQGELISYKRANQAGPKESVYFVYRTDAPGQLLAVMSLVYPQIGRVRKQRTIFMIGRTRVFVDQVEGLGDFMELEVVMRDDEPSQRGVEEAELLIDKLGLAQSQRIEVAYVDLLRIQG